MLTELFLTNLASITVTKGGTDIPPPETVETLTVEESDGIVPVVRRGIEQFHFKDRNPEHGQEILCCIGTKGNHWTVIRGAEGSLPVRHNRTFSIRQVITSEFLQRLGAGSTTELCNAVTVFGADPTGTELSGAAISRSLDSGPVYLPSGVYSIQLPINVLPGQSIISFGNVVIKPTSDFTGDAAIEFVDGSGVSRLDGITLDGSELGAGSDVYGVFAETDELEAELRNVRITSFPNSGIIASGTGWMLDRISSIRNYGSGFEVALPHSAFVGCRAIENVRYGFVGANPDQLFACISKGNKLGDRA